MRGSSEVEVAGGRDGTTVVDGGPLVSVVPDTRRQEVLVEAARRLGRDPRFDGVDDAAVADEVCTGAARIAAATARWLQAVAELVVRGVWAQDGASTPAAWLSWACGVSPTTAREHVRVALRLRECPLIAQRFVAGTLSYSKVRALTRVSTPITEAMLCTWADDCTAAQLERLIADTRRVQRAGEAPAVRDDLGLRRRWCDDGTYELVLRVDPATGVGVDQHIDRLRELDDTPHRPVTTLADVHEEPDAAAETLPSAALRLAYAVIDAISAAVAAGPIDTSGADRHQIVVHTSVEALLAATGDDVEQPTLGGAGEVRHGGDADLDASAEASGRGVLVRDGRGRVRAMSVRQLRRLACTAALRPVVTVATDGADGANPADLGRTRREPDARLRRLLQARDGSCRFPGCGATRHLHAHHVRWWSEGGTTDLSNLVLLCRHHHTVVHDRGWTLRADGVGRWTFHPPGDHRLAHGAPWPASYRPSGAPAEALAAAVAAHAPDVGPRSLIPPLWDGTEPDRDLAVAVLLERTLGSAA